MKTRNIIATAALMLASLGVSTAASAQGYGYGNHDRGYQDRGHQDRRYSDHRNDGRWQRHHGWRNERRCWTEWRHHNRIRVCR